MANKRRRRRRRSNPLVNILLIALSAVAAALIIIFLIINSRPAPEPAPVSYPVEYVDEILAAAGENSIPPAYIAAVIMAESSYNPTAVSSVGAQGLMQIMPETGQWISKKVDDEYYDGRMFDPAANIKYGSWYLGWLMERYGGDMRCATAAYHAGQGTVDKWLADPAYSADGETLAVIAYDSTSTYVDRIMKYYEYYAEAYENVRPSAETIE